MAKGVKRTEGKELYHPNGKQTQFEHHESFDDSLLPDANELAKLKELDPNIIDWIKERTSLEQDARHKFNDRRMTLVETATQKSISTDRLAMIFAFIIVMSGMGFSSFLIIKGLSTEGTVFAGATILGAALAFLNIGKGKDKKDKKAED